MKERKYMLKCLYNINIFSLKFIWLTYKQFCIIKFNKIQNEKKYYQINQSYIKKSQCQACYYCQ